MAKTLFATYGVLSERELASRYEVALEHYALSVGVEVRSTLEIGSTVILPAAIRSQTELASNAGSLRSIGYDFDPALLDKVCAGIADLQAALGGLQAALDHHGAESTFDEAVHAGSELVPSTLAVRTAVDTLEEEVADDLWPLATYQEMLFIL